MAAENADRDPYEAVLADLRAKRDQIDQTIKLLEAMRGGSVATATMPASSAALAPEERAESAGAFLGMTIPDAAKKLLALRKRALSSAEISAAIQAGGLTMNSADPVNTIGSVLTRRFNITGDIVRVSRGMWGLAEWYPNRNFRKKPTRDNGNGEAKGDASAPVPPSEPTADAVPE
jgi:hypothetical protein